MTAIHSYEEILNYLYAQLPMFHRIGAAAYKANLDNTLAICAALDNPEKKFNSIHIAGTNGKGSSSHLLAAIFQQAGYKTGLYTSPHLIDFRERIKINGKEIPKEKVIDFVNTYQSTFETIQPSFFEWTVGLAFHYFASEKVDISIIETGLGGRLDSTNVITPECCLITNISKDHMALLGDSYAKIAYEKAGIIKPGVPIVISQRQEHCAGVFTEVAEKNNTTLTWAEEESRTQWINPENPEAGMTLSDSKYTHVLHPDLKGAYQVKNIAGVWTVCQIMEKKGWKGIDPEIRIKAIEQAATLTGLQGRWQCLGERPKVIADTGHNEDGIKEIVQQIRRVPFQKLYFVLGMANDKDAGSILALLPKEAHYIICQADIPRAMPCENLLGLAVQFGLQAETGGTVPEAIKKAQKKAGENDLLFIGGSTFVVADALKALEEKKIYFPENQTNN